MAMVCDRWGALMPASGLFFPGGLPPSHGQYRRRPPCRRKGFAEQGDGNLLPRTGEKHRKSGASAGHIFLASHPRHAPLKIGF